MDTSKASRGASRNNIVLGSGLSGMVAAYISARALEDNAYQNSDWRAEQAFHPWIRGWRARRIASHGGGTPVVP